MIRVYPHWPGPQPSQAATIGDHNLPRHEQEHSREHFAPPLAKSVVGSNSPPLGLSLEIGLTVVSGAEP